MTLLSCQYIAQCFHRVVEYHPRSAEPHDFAYLFPHVWTVAMDIALMAFGLSFTELASVESGRCIRLSVFQPV